MSALIGDKAVIGGAGIGGLAAAAFLSPLFREIVVLEKDTLSPSAEPRKGANQGAHIHVLLKGGALALEKALPGIEQDFVDAGAATLNAAGDHRIFDHGAYRASRDLGFSQFYMSRPAYEAVIRARVRALSNVTLQPETRIANLVIENEEAVGFATMDGVVSGDFVVDGRGRGGALVKELKDAGYDDVVEDVIGIQMAYGSARVRPNEASARKPELLMCIPTPPDGRCGLAFPIEGGDWIVSLGGRGEILPPTEEAGFRAYAETLVAPDIADLLKASRLTTPIKGYKKPTANWRRFELQSKFPRRLAPVGDAIASYNPIYGQGMSVAARHGEMLAATLKRHEPDSARLTREYLGKAALVTVQAWKFAAFNDLAYPQVTGARDADFDEQLRFQNALRQVCDEDADVHRLMIEVQNMMRSPAALGEASVVAKVEAIMAGA